MLRRFMDMGDPNSLVMRLRKRRSLHIKALIDRIHAEKGSCHILDLGGAARYWAIFDRDYLLARNCRVLVVNLYEHGENDEIFTFANGDATNLSEYADRSFDLVHANSVVEHMGSWVAMEAFAREVRRLADRYYVQTPNFWFPYEPHFRFPCVHWMPEQVRAELLMRLNLGFGGRRKSYDAAMRGVQSAALLSGRQMRDLFPDAELVKERAFGLPKSFMAIRGSTR